MYVQYNTVYIKSIYKYTYIKLRYAWVNVNTGTLTCTILNSIVEYNLTKRTYSFEWYAHKFITTWNNRCYTHIQHILDLDYTHTKPS